MSFSLDGMRSLRVQRRGGWGRGGVLKGTGGVRLGGGRTCQNNNGARHRPRTPLVRAALPPLSSPDAVLPLLPWVPVASLAPAVSASPNISFELAEGYAKSSYYTALGLFLLSLPGLWSLIKRSTKSKIVRKTYMLPGPELEEGVPLNETASSIASYFASKNYAVDVQGPKVVFTGEVKPSFGTASYITFCAFLGLGSLALVLSITQAEGSTSFWYLLTLLSPAAGYYYYSNSGRTESVEVKMLTSDDDKTTEVVCQGDDEELQRFAKEMSYMEKGKVYVKGIFETAE